MLSESDEWPVTERRQLLGNFPQAFSQVGLVTAAWDLDRKANADTYPSRVQARTISPRSPGRLSTTRTTS